MRHQAHTLGIGEPGNRRNDHDLQHGATQQPQQHTHLATDQHAAKPGIAGARLRPPRRDHQRFAPA